MGYLIKMPQMGLEMEQGEVVAWEVDVGEVVDSGDVVALIESEKATNEIEAREDGAVREIHLPEGGVAEPGDPIGIFAGPDEDISGLEAEAGMATESKAESTPESTEPGETTSTTTASASGSPRSTDGETATAAQGVRATPGARARAEENDVDLTTVTGTGPQGTITEADVEEALGDRPDEQGGEDTSSVRATPGAKQAATEANVDLSAVEGTGPQGVVTKADVEQHASAAETGDTATGDDDSVATRTVSERRERSKMQLTVADRMTESAQNAPQVTLNRDIDTTAIQNVVTAAANEGVDISVTDLLLAGFGAQLAETPAFNAVFEDGEHKLIEEVNIGVAVDLEDGLVTPVVPFVEDKTVEELSAVRERRTDRALSGSFEVSDMEGGTFTVTNLGMFGVDSFDPIINPPEVAILGVGRIRDDDTMSLSLSFDHRVVNGADAARFLDSAAQKLTDASWLAGRFEADVLGSLVDVLST